MTVSLISRLNNIIGLNGEDKKPAKTEPKEKQQKNTYTKDSVSIKSKKAYHHELTTFEKGADYGNLSVKLYGGTSYSNDLEFGRTFSVISAKTKGDLIPFIAQSGQVGFGLSQAGPGYKINAGAEFHGVSVSLSGQVSTGVIPYNLTPYIDARGGVEFRANIGSAGGSITINPSYGVTNFGGETEKSFGVSVGYTIKQF